MPKKPDNIVGESEGAIVGGGRQTPEQRKLTEQSGGGLSDAQRSEAWKNAGGEPGRAPVALGGSSQGQADRMPSEKAKSGERASNPAVTPGHKHETS